MMNGILMGKGYLPVSIAARHKLEYSKLKIPFYETGNPDDLKAFLKKNIPWPTKWLKNSPPPGFGKAEKISPGNFQSALKGRTGVVFFQDFWRRGNESETHRSGDHIDLWNKSKITSSSMWWRSVIEYFDIVSDLNSSKAVLFWEVK